MRGIFGGLALTLAVLLNFIELSTQINPVMRPPIAPSRSSRLELPSPYYMDKFGIIKARGHPNARPVVEGDFFTGATDGKNFFPIIEDGRMYIINLKTHKYTEVEPKHMHEIQRHQSSQSAGSSSSGGHHYNSNLNVLERISNSKI